MRGMCFPGAKTSQMVTRTDELKPSDSRRQETTARSARDSWMTAPLYCGLVRLAGRTGRTVTAADT